MRALCIWFVSLHLCLAQTDQSQLASHAAKAREAQERGDFKAAAQELETVTKLAPNVSEAFSNLGMMYHFDQQYARAVEAFQQAAKLNPNLVAPQLFLGIDYYLTARTSAAIPHLKAALALAPNDAMALKWLAMTSYELGDFTAALGELAKARQAAPQDSDLLFYQSRTYSKLLFQSYEEIRRIDSRSPFLKALRDRTTVSPAQAAETATIQADMQSNRLRDAFEASDKLITRFPQIPLYWYWFGRASEALALQSLDQFFQSSPDSYRSDQLKAEYALATGNDDAAIDEFHRALSRNPNAAMLHESVGNIFMARHEYELAIPEYEAETRINPYALVSLERMGQAYAELHDPGRAVACLNRALAIDAHSYEALRALAKVDFERGDYANAARNYRLALQVNEAAEPAILFQLSRTYKALGDSGQASQWLARFRTALAKQQSPTQAVSTVTSGSGSR